MDGHESFKWVRSVVDVHGDGRSSVMNSPLFSENWNCKSFEFLLRYIAAAGDADVITA